MNNWFRMYGGMPRNPKIAALSDYDFRIWIELLCLSCEVDGRPLSLDEISVSTRIRSDNLQRALNRLVTVGVIDLLQGSLQPLYVIHNWGKRQYKSKASKKPSRAHKQNRTEQSNIYSSDKSSEYTPSEDGDLLSVKDVWDAYLELAGELKIPVPSRLTKERRVLIQGRIGEYKLDEFQTVFDNCRGSAFLRGSSTGRSPLSIDWLMKKANFLKVLEGNYSDGK